MRWEHRRFHPAEAMMSGEGSRPTAVHADAMLSSLFPLLYGLIFIALLWQAFKVMSRGFSAAGRPLGSEQSRSDRTGKVTIHPELLDGDGRLTEENLLTVRFSEDDEGEPADRSGE